MIDIDVTGCIPRFMMFSHIDNHFDHHIIIFLLYPEGDEIVEECLLNERN